MPSNRKLGKPTDQRMAMLRGLVTDLLNYGQLKTTVTRAKEVQPLADKMVTLAKQNDLAAYRQALAFLTQEDVAKKLFDQIGPKYADRNGGYTRWSASAPGAATRLRWPSSSWFDPEPELVSAESVLCPAQCALLRPWPRGKNGWDRNVPVFSALPGALCRACPTERWPERTGREAAPLCPGSTGAVGARAGETRGRLTRPGAQGTIGRSNCKGEDKPCFREHHSFFPAQSAVLHQRQHLPGQLPGPALPGAAHHRRGEGSSRCWPACAGMESTVWRRARWWLRPAFPWTQRAGRR